MALTLAVIEVLHDLGALFQEVVVHILAIADVMPLHDRHDLLGLDEHARVTGSEGVRDMRVPSDSGIDRLGHEKGWYLRAIRLE